MTAASLYSDWSFFPDRAAGFRELRRVLRPDGRAVVSSMASVGGPFAMVLQSIKTMLPELPSQEGGGPLSEPEAMTREMSAVGFRQVAIHTTTHSLSRPSLSAYWESVQRSAAPVALLRRRLGEERWAKVAGGVFKRLYQALGEGPVEEHYTAHMGVGTA